MNISKKIKVVVVAGVLSLALATPMFTPAVNVGSGSTVVTSLAKSGKLTKKQALKKLKKKIKADGDKTKYTFKYQVTEAGYHVFFIYDCTTGACSPVGYGEIHMRTGKIHYLFGI